MKVLWKLFYGDTVKYYIAAFFGNLYSCCYLFETLFLSTASKVSLKAIIVGKQVLSFGISQVCVGQPMEVFHNA